MSIDFRNIPKYPFYFQIFWTIRMTLKQCVFTFLPRTIPLPCRTRFLVSVPTISLLVFNDPVSSPV